MSEPPRGPVRVTSPLGTAILIAPQAYYSHFFPLLQERNWRIGCAAHTKAALRQGLGAAFCVSGENARGGSLPFPRPGPLTLPSVLDGHSVTAVDERAFFLQGPGMKMLPKRLVIPEGYTTLERSAFDGLDLREGGVFPSTLTTVGPGAFFDG